MTDLLFQPSPEQIAASQLTAFADQLTRSTGQSFASYQELQRYSVTELAAFWAEVWRFGQVRGEMGDRVLTDQTMPGVEWFPEARLNFAENLLAAGAPDHSALIACSESRPEIRLSYRELTDQTLQLAAFLQQDCAVQPGDRVVAYLGNTPEALIGMLATAYLGAIWASASPDFGFEGACDRFSQIEPKVMLAGNGYQYGGKTYNRHEVVAQLRSAMPSVTHLVNVAVLPDAPALANSVEFASLVEGDRPVPELRRWPFNQPLYILFSSGTTGKPKCIIHGAGGTLLQHIKEHRLHADLSADSVLFYFTTTGWMMWNWLASGLSTGATLVLYDGNPMYPAPSILWQLAARHGFTHFGTSAKFLSACRSQDMQTDDLDLSALRAVFSTGSPLAPEDFDWVYRAIKQDLMLHSISGGTDIVSCFVGGNPWQPVRRGKIQGANLGMAVESWNDQGEAVIDQRGELVCTAPAPCMPLGFWQDELNRRYHAAYFERFPGIWAQGDFCSIDALGQVVILGRSDTTLNPGGVRIGTAEIYRQVDGLAEIADSLVVGRATDDDVEVVLFIELAAACELDDALRQRIRQAIRSNTTPRHVPSHILAVDAIPYTRSGKKVELAVTQILRGELPQNLSALANAECLEQYHLWAERLNKSN